MRKIADLFAQSQNAARAGARIHALEEAARICDLIGMAGSPEHILGAAECASRIRSRLNGKAGG